MEQYGDIEEILPNDNESTLSDRKSSDSCIMSSNKINIELDVEEALDNGNTEKAREIIQNNLEYISRIDSIHPITGETILHLLSREGPEDIAILLIQTNKKLLYIADASFSYPIHHAAFNRHEQLVSMMISIDPLILTQLDLVGECALHGALRSKSYKMLTLMLHLAYNSENGKKLVENLNELRNEFNETYLDLYKKIAGPNCKPLEFFDREN